MVRFGVALFRDRVWGIVVPTGWTSPDKLPSWVRRGLEPELLRGLRGVRGGGQNLPGAPGFREGWVLEQAGGLFFAFRSRGWKARILPLTELQEEGRRVGKLARRIGFRDPEGTPSALFLQREGPSVKRHK